MFDIGSTLRAELKSSIKWNQSWEPIHSAFTEVCRIKLLWQYVDDNFPLYYPFKNKKSLMIFCF